MELIPSVTIPLSKWSNNLNDPGYGFLAYMSYLTLSLQDAVRLANAWVIVFEIVLSSLFSNIYIKSSIIPDSITI
jgi:hypothetical protein